MSKLCLKYKNWSKLGTEQQLYLYNPKLYRYNLAKNDQKRKCTGTNSNCTGTSLRKVPRRCNFSHFSCTFPSQTKSILHIHFKIISNASYILNYTQIIFQYTSIFKIFHDFLPKTILIWVITHTHTKYTNLLGFFLTQPLYIAIKP